MTRERRPPERYSAHQREWFDPAAEGARHRLSREISLAIWERACAEATDGIGRWDDDLARRRFRELAEHVAAHGGRIGPDVGRITRVAMEIERSCRSSPAEWFTAPGHRLGLERETARIIGPRMGIAATPGRRTLVGELAFSTRLGFNDYRVLGLKDVLQRLGPGHLLRPEVIAAASADDRSIAGRATLWCERLPDASSATPDGRAVWQAAERHAATLYRRAATNELADVGDPAVDTALQQRGAGVLLPLELRRAMERELGVALVGVRIHTDAVAAQAARALAADAFTVGEDIFFADGMFSPGTRAGWKLLAHELAHVAQALHGRVPPAGDVPHVSRPGEPLEQEAEAVAGRIETMEASDMLSTPPASGGIEVEASSSVPLSAPARLSSDSLVLRSPAGAEQMAPVRPAVQSDFVLHVGSDDFVVSFELLPKAGAGAAVRVVVSPTDFSRARQSLVKYWDVRGREVKKDDNWTTIGNVGTDAVPWVLQIPIVDQTRFDPVLLKALPERNATVWTFDWNGDSNPEFAIRVDYTISNFQRAYNFTAGPNGAAYKFDFSFIQDEAWKYGYQGPSVPRREGGDFVDFLGDILTSKTTWETAITMIPIIGEVVLLGEAVTGYTIFGDKMSTAERVVSGLAALLPVAGGVLAKGMTNAGLDLAKIATKIGRSEEEVAALLRAAEKQGGEAATVQKWHSALHACGKLTAEDVTRLQRVVRQLEADQRVFRAAEQEMGAGRILRKGGKLEQTGPVSLKRLRTTLGRSGVSPSGYHLRKATKADLDALRATGTDPSSVFAWVSRDGSNILAKDARGRPVITFTDKGLSSLEEAVKTFGHEAQHVRDFAAGMATSNEALAEKAGVQLWELVQKRLGQ